MPPWLWEKHVSLARSGSHSQLNLRKTGVEDLSTYQRKGEEVVEKLAHQSPEVSDMAFIEKKMLFTYSKYIMEEFD